MKLVEYKDFNLDEFKDTLLKLDKPALVDEDKLSKHLNVVIAHDIETATIETDKGLQSILYCWQFSFDNEYAIYGYGEYTLITFIDILNDVIDEIGKQAAYVYIHNLNFEFGMESSLIRTTNHGIIEPHDLYKFNSGKIQFRCSYKLTGQSLEAAAKSYNAKHQKQVGKWDYNKVRIPGRDKMTKDELDYAMFDVYAVVDIIEFFRSIEDTKHVKSIPFTKTGILKRDIKQLINDKDGNNTGLYYWNIGDSLNGNDREDVLEKIIDWIKPGKKDINLYSMLLWAVRGGNTASNRYKTNVVVKDVMSYDIKSSYPNIYLNHDLPGKFEFIGEVDATVSKEDQRAKLDDLKLLALNGKNKHNLAFVADVVFENLKVKSEAQNAYLSMHKLRMGYNDLINTEVVNNRLIDSKGALIKTTITDIDLDIIDMTYTYDNMYVTRLYLAPYMRVCEPIREIVLKYFSIKETYDSDDPNRVLAKANVNSVYGLALQNFFKDKVKYDINTNEFIKVLLDNDMDAKTKENYYISCVKNQVLPFQWGVWIAAKARLELQKGINACGDKFLYCDTDSIYFKRDEDVINRIEALNEKQKELCRIRNSVISDKDGNEVYIGVWEHDSKKDSYKYFKTLGAKKYVVAYDDKVTRDKDGNVKSVKITVSGLKKAAVNELCEGYKNTYDVLDNEFVPGREFIKEESCGLGRIYNNETFVTKYDGLDIKIKPNVVLVPRHITLGLDDTFDKFWDENPDYKIIAGMQVTTI